MRPLFPIASLTIAVSVFAACDRYEPQPSTGFHQDFVWGPAHGDSLEVLTADTDRPFEANNFCDKCHIGAASQQVADQAVNDDGVVVTVADAATQWVTVPSQDCGDCHPLRVGLVEPIVCVPGADSEYCRFQAAGGVHANTANGCDGFACHSVMPPTDWSTGSP